MVDRSLFQIFNYSVLRPFSAVFRRFFGPVSPGTDEQKTRKTSAEGCLSCEFSLSQVCQSYNI